MPEREPTKSGLEQREGNTLPLADLAGRMRVEFARQRILNLREQEKELADHLQEAYQKCHEEVCSFLGIEPETRLAKRWAEEILAFAERRSLDPKIFASRLVITIMTAQRVEKYSGSLPLYTTAEWSYWQAVSAMREQGQPSMPEEPRQVYPRLKDAIDISGKEVFENPTMENRCQHAVYRWITQELYNLESFWWVIVGEPK